MLVEEGASALNDRVADLRSRIRALRQEGDITVRHLLTHESGLRPDVDWPYELDGYDTAIELAIEEVPVAAPSERFIYSDINFFLLGEIVSRVSGRAARPSSPGRASSSRSA